MSVVLLGLFGIVCMAGALRGCMQMADDSKMVHCVAHALHFQGSLSAYWEHLDGLILHCGGVRP